MTVADLPLTKIFRTTFVVYAAVVAFMLFKVLESIVNYKPSDGGLVGAWLVVIPVVALALLAGLFLMFKAPWVRFGLIVMMVFPAWGPMVARPIHSIREQLAERARVVGVERERVGEHIFSEAGPRKLAAAIADRDLARIKAALPGAGDINRQVSRNLSYGVPLGHNETFLSFALWKADESQACVEVIELLLSAGANPNLPHGVPMYGAMRAGVRIVDILRRAGGNVNAATDSQGSPLWWSVLEHGDSESSDVTMLQYLLDHGADTRKRLKYGPGPVEIALDRQRWAAVALLAQRMPGVKDEIVGRYPGTGREGEAVHVRLAREVKALQKAGKPIPEDMAAALAALEVAGK